jgi:hypothetical protein
MRDRIAIQQAWQQQEVTAGVGVGWRFGFAAAFVALIGLNVVTSNRLPISQPLVSDTQEPAYRDFADSVIEDLATRNPVWDDLLASNRIDTLHKVPEPVLVNWPR